MRNRKLHLFAQRRLSGLIDPRTRTESGWFGLQGSATKGSDAVRLKTREAKLNEYDIASCINSAQAG